MGNKLRIAILWGASQILALAFSTAIADNAVAGPVPLLNAGHAVNWWFVFKFNAQTFPDHSEALPPTCVFGGIPESYRSFSQTYAVASEDSPQLALGPGRVGTSTDDPVGATFAQVYKGNLYYVVWNDQFYDDPAIEGCIQSCSAPWGHSKGIIAWDHAGDGFVMQVTTPSWPAAGSQHEQRESDGNTLGCLRDNNLQTSQDFFATRLTKDDLIKVLAALSNASVVTDPTDPQIFNNGGPPDVRAAAAALGPSTSASRHYTDSRLSTGVEIISKPSRLDVPPWQLVSAVLDAPLRVASWWAAPRIPSAGAWEGDREPVACWDPSLGHYHRVEIATSGQWNGRELDLRGGVGSDFNRAKIGISTAGTHAYSIFGDLDQQGGITANRCDIGQNERGGLFFVIDNQALHDSVGSLIAGSSAGSSQ